jgi:hypothetical protein
MRSGGGGDRPKLSHHLPTGVRPTAIPEREENFYTRSSLQALLMGLSHIFGERVKEYVRLHPAARFYIARAHVLYFLISFIVTSRREQVMPC